MKKKNLKTVGCIGLCALLGIASTSALATIRDCGRYENPPRPALEARYAQAHDKCMKANERDAQKDVRFDRAQKGVETARSITEVAGGIRQLFGGSTSE
jgi:hypothetical protein